MMAMMAGKQSGKLKLWCVLHRQNPPEGMGDQPLRYPQTEWLSNLQRSIARRWWLLGFDTSPIGRIQCMWPFGTSTSSKQQPSRLEK